MRRFNSVEDRTFPFCHRYLLVHQMFAVRIVALLVLALFTKLCRLATLFAVMMILVISTIFLVLLLFAVLLVVLFASVLFVVVTLFGLFVLVPDLITLQKIIKMIIRVKNDEII